MKKAFGIVPMLLAACANSSTGVVSTGPDTYMIAKTGGFGVSGAEVSADLYREANAFCTQQNRQFLRISLNERDKRPFVRAANSKLEFRCTPTK